MTQSPEPSQHNEQQKPEQQQPESQEQKVGQSSQDTSQDFDYDPKLLSELGESH